MAENSNKEFRYMLELPNKVKIFSSDEQLLNKVLDKCGLVKNSDTQIAEKNTINELTLENKLENEPLQKSNLHSLQKIKIETQDNRKILKQREDISKDQIIRLIKEFTLKNERPPKSHEPELKNIKYSAEKLFGSWRNALIAADVSSYLEWRKGYTLASTIRKILNNNPLTMHDLKKELQKIPKFSNYSKFTIVSHLYSSKDIHRTGPHGHKLYFLKGQEPQKQVYPELNILDRTEVEQKILEYLSSPMTKNEIYTKFQSDGYCGLNSLINSSLNRLWRNEKIWRLHFKAHASGGQKYSALNLFGSIAGKLFYCNSNYPQELLKFVQQNMKFEPTNQGLNRAITLRLKRILPRNVFEML